MDKSTYKHLFRGAAWTIGMRWVMRFIGFINVIILARILTPEDFGLVALAMIVAGFAESFTEAGAQQLLIRTRDITRVDKDTAWTVHVCQGLLVAAIVAISAHWAAVAFDDPRIEPIAYVLAVAALILGFRNIGLTLARRDLDFALDFRITVVTRLTTFVATLALVLWLRSYWALVYGQVIGALLSVLFSYVMHPYRPRICFVKIEQYLRFSTAIIPMRIADYATKKVPILVVNSFGGVTQVGLYNVARDLASTMTSEIAVPLSRGLFPGFARLSNEPARLADAFRNVLGASASVFLPLGVGLALVSGDLVPLLLGDQWIPSAPFVFWLALFSCVAAINKLMTTQILIVSGHERRSAILAWVRLVCLSAAVWLGAQVNGAEGVAMACTLFALAFLPVCATVLSRSIPLSVYRIATVLIRPALACAGMALMLVLVREYLPANPFVRLGVEVVLGALSYVVVLFGSWQLVGRPQGLEKLVFMRLAKAGV